jgi:peptidoglycan hydrolase-like protein with peptidoglycan-binding domain
MNLMPTIRQVPSPNYSPTLIAHDLIIVHMMEGGYAGSVAWLCKPSVGASAHLLMSEDGSEVTQLVPLQFKAWAECSFNGCGVSLEIPGFTAQGIPTARWSEAARIVAWLCQAYAIPPVWAQGGQGRGVCQHHDLGAAGGGHVDCSGVGSPTWLTFMGLVKDAFDAFGNGPLPAWALHGLPAPHATELPPAVTPTPSHGGADRSEPGDVVPHPTKSGFPLGSISDWQWRLRAIGANPQLGLDGDEGPATRAAIGTFQRAEGLLVTNDVNPETWAKLAALTN